MSNTIMSILKYVFLIFIGLLLILLCSMFQQVEPPEAGEYYYSSFLRNNYTILSASLFLLVGILVGYFFKLNPWLVGLSLILIFPLVSFYEATIYRGSHNLIPFELIVYFLWALPGIAGVYLGR